MEEGRATSDGGVHEDQAPVGQPLDPTRFVLPVPQDVPGLSPFQVHHPDLLLVVRSRREEKRMCFGVGGPEEPPLRSVLAGDSPGFSSVGGDDEDVAVVPRGFVPGGVVGKLWRWSPVRPGERSPVGNWGRATKAIQRPSGETVALRWE